MTVTVRGHDGAGKLPPLVTQLTVTTFGVDGNGVLRCHDENGILAVFAHDGWASLVVEAE